MTFNSHSYPLMVRWNIDVIERLPRKSTGSQVVVVVDVIGVVVLVLVDLYVLIVYSQLKSMAQVFHTILWIE